jgi:hypothetical protein
MSIGRLTALPADPFWRIVLHCNFFVTSNKQNFEKIWRVPVARNLITQSLRAQFLTAAISVFARRNSPKT